MPPLGIYPIIHTLYGRGYIRSNMCVSFAYPSCIFRISIDNWIVNLFCETSDGRKRVFVLKYFCQEPQRIQETLIPPSTPSPTSLEALSPQRTLCTPYHSTSITHLIHPFSLTFNPQYYLNQHRPLKLDKQSCMAKQFPQQQRLENA
jgi:hypothetical protein